LNYIKELNAFYKLNEQSHLTPNEQALYNYLLHKCNTFGWARYFTLTNTQIMAEVNIQKSSLHYARENLIKKGYIVYKKGSVKQCGTYSLISLENKVTFEGFDKPVEPVIGTVVGTVIEPVSEPVVGTLNKQNKNKQNYIYKENKNKNYFNPNVIPKRKKESWEREHTKEEYDEWDAYWLNKLIEEFGDELET